MRARLKEAIREQDPTTVVLFLLDSSIYYGRQEDGSNMASRRDTAGNFHIEGELAVCGRDTLQLKHFNTLKPILDLTAKKRGDSYLSDAEICRDWLLLRVQSLLK
jgi:hypothetical protein